jgi:hypothetical protein
VVRAGLLVLLAGLGGQAERDGVFGQGLIKLTGGEQDLAEAVERVGLAVPAL